MSLKPVELYEAKSGKIARFEITKGPLAGQQLIVNKVEFVDNEPEATVDYDFLGKPDLTEQELEEMIGPMIEQMLVSALQNAIDQAKLNKEGKDGQE